MSFILALFVVLLTAVYVPLLRKANHCDLPSFLFIVVFFFPAGAVCRFDVSGQDMLNHFHAEARINEVAVFAEWIILPAVGNLPAHFLHLFGIPDILQRGCVEIPEVSNFEVVAAAQTYLSVRGNPDVRKRQKTRFGDHLFRCLLVR